MGNELKRKAAMVLHQIEESLGNFVLNNGDIESLNLESLENIHRREVDKGKIFSKKSIKDIVEATYLDELFGFALDIAHDTSISDSVNYLYSLFHHLDIYEVRNAVSHPNRPFWDCYWYRVAAVASDPVNEILGLIEVKEVLAAAESNMIQDPPEEWIQKVIWQIPNNLPTRFDHGLTGLIGRSKELQELKKFISNPRINTIALVAPGGAGKTALALDLLNGIVSTPTFTKFVDAVLYTTMKTEKLTSDGVISLDSIETMEELKTNIVDSINNIFDENYKDFDEVIEDKKNEKVLLCIDNLETLLRDNQKSFEDINYVLPPSWQVLVTSRVSISNASILSLDTLKEKSAIHLARTYLSKRGGSPLNDSLYKKLTKGCFYNPLAIRLTIDLVITGQDIPESLNVANKEIAEFSFNNLIDALSGDAIEILETVFVEDSSTRLSLCELLNKNLDDISSAIGELSKTSLISRISSEQGESYKLSDSVRDLLVISPRNIGVRTKVQESIHKRRMLSNEIDIRQEKKELPIWHSNFIPKDTNQNLKILVTEVGNSIGKARRNTDVAVILFRKLKDSKFIYEGNNLYHRAFGRVLEVLKDYNSAEDHYKRAINTEKSDPSSMYLLARLYHSTKRYDEARITYQNLIDTGWTNDDDDRVSFGKSIYNGFFLALLYSGSFEEVLRLTKDWKKSKKYRGVLGTYRASGWKRKAEDFVNDNPEVALDALLSSLKILSDVFRTEGYFNTANKQALKVFEEIEFCFSRRGYCAKYSKQGTILLQLIAKNIVEIGQSGNGLEYEILIKKLSKIQIANNPFTESNWSNMSKYVGYDYFDEKDDKPRGLITVKISNRPKDKASFFFAKDAYGQDYFLHYDNFKDGSWRDWCQLSLGMNLDIVSDEGEKNQKATKANEIYFAN